jgi:hypothetical protein
MTKLKGKYYVRQWAGKWDVTSECDDDELYVQGAPNKEVAQALCNLINIWIERGAL